MSYWSHNPEAYDEILVQEALRRKEAGEIDFDEEELSESYSPYAYLVDKVGGDLVHKMLVCAEADYWGSKIDEATALLESNRDSQLMRRPKDGKDKKDK